MSIFDRIFGSSGDTAVKETRLPYSLDTKNGKDSLMMDFLKIKRINSLNELPAEQFLFIFGEGKSHVIDNYLSGIGGNEDYCVAMAIIAHQLRIKHGDLIEVHCLDGPKIELVYKNSHIITIKEHSGYLDLTLIKYGYRGTGPDCFHAFMNENGFRLTKDDIAQIKPPFNIKKGETKWVLNKEQDIESKNAQELCDRGYTLYVQGHHNEAIQYFEKVLDIEPENSEAWHNKGHSHFALGEYDDAIECMDKAHEIDPNNSEIQQYRETYLRIRRP